MNLYYRDRIERYISRDVQKNSRSMSESDFYEYSDNEGDVWPIENPYDQIPVFHFRSQWPYGRSDLADAYGVQNILNRYVANQLATVDYQVLPQRYVRIT